MVTQPYDMTYGSLEASNIYLLPSVGGRGACGGGGGGRDSAVIPPATHGTRLSDSCRNTNDMVVS